MIRGLYFVHVLVMLFCINMVQRRINYNVYFACYLWLLKAWLLKVTVYDGVLFPEWECTGGPHTVNVMNIVDKFTVGILVPFLK